VLRRNAGRVRYEPAACVLTDMREAFDDALVTGWEELEAGQV
jgi:hypothetical protein